MPNQSVLIFGAGAAGVNAHQHLARAGTEISAFVDNNPAKQGTLVDGIQVISPAELATISSFRVLIASEFFEKIQRQLQDEFDVPEDVIEVLPSWMLAPMQFRDSKQIDNIAVNILLALCKHFESTDIHHFIDAGTLLGIYRDGHLIPWDDDLDIGVPVSDVDAARQALEGFLPDLLTLTGEAWQVETHRCQNPYGAIKVNDIRCFKLKPVKPKGSLPMVDVFIKYVEGNNMDYTLASRGITVPSLHLSPLQFISFCGQELAIPFDPEGYLECYYGDWRTPMQNWDLSMIKAAKVHDS